jgi:hypothetical protein
LSFDENDIEKGGGQEINAELTEIEDEEIAV